MTSLQKKPPKRSANDRPERADAKVGPVVAPMKRPRNAALDSIHSAVEGLFKSGVIDKETMRSFDASCLEAVPALSAAEITQLRMDAKLSQPVFAMHLGTTKSTVQKWESGAKAPSGPAQKLLSIVRKHGLQILL